MAVKNTYIAGEQWPAQDVNDIVTSLLGLAAYQQATPDLTLKIRAGVVKIGATVVKYAGGNSPSFTAPAANPRIDLLTIDSAGTVARTAGVEAGSPSVPTYPSDKFVIAEVYNRVGQTAVYNSDQGGSTGYIYRDARALGGALLLDQFTATYNEDDTVATLTDNGGGTVYTFNYSDGLLSTITTATNTWTFTYDGAQRLTNVAIT